MHAAVRQIGTELKDQLDALEDMIRKTIGCRKTVGRLVAPAASSSLRRSLRQVKSPIGPRPSSRGSRRRPKRRRADHAHAARGRACSVGAAIAAGLRPWSVARRWDSAGSAGGARPSTWLGSGHPCDPNAMYGPPGNGPDHTVQRGSPMTFSAEFENDAECNRLGATWSTYRYHSTRREIRSISRRFVGQGSGHARGRDDHARCRRKWRHHHALQSRHTRDDQGCGRPHLEDARRRVTGPPDGHGSYLDFLPPIRRPCSPKATGS